MDELSQLNLSLSHFQVALTGQDVLDPTLRYIVCST